MNRFSKALLVVGLVGMTLIGAGCQSTTSASKDADSDVYFTINHTLYHLQGGRGNGRVVHYRSEKNVAACAECVVAGEDYFKTGTLKKFCETCQANRVVFNRPRP